MAIGYANFGNIQQGNQQVVNSMVGLGQSIAGAINTHAATESAKAMLPMLQQQYQSGMQKIASGDPNGLGDIYGAALTASQNPLLAPMAKNAVTMAQSANINAQHMLRTQAYAQGRNLNLMAKYPGFINPSTGEINPNYKGVPDKGSILTAGKKADLVAKYRGATQGLWSGGDGVDGAGSYLADFLDPAGKKEKADKFVSAVKQYNTYKQDLADQGIQFSDPNFESAIAEASKETFDLQQRATSNPKEMVDQYDIPLFGKRGGRPISKDLETMESRFKQIAPSSSRLPSVQEDQDDQMQQGNATFNSPADVKSAFQAGKISQDQAVQLLQSFPSK